MDRKSFLVPLLVVTLLTSGPALLAQEDPAPEPPAERSTWEEVQIGIDQAFGTLLGWASWLPFYNMASLVGMDEPAVEVDAEGRPVLGPDGQPVPIKGPTGQDGKSPRAVPIRRHPVSRHDKARRALRQSGHGLPV